MEDWGTGGLVDWRTGGLEDWRTGGLEDWRTGGLDNTYWAVHPGKPRCSDGPGGLTVMVRTVLRH